MTTAILSQHERGLTSIGAMSKMAKFYSTTSETISKLFVGSELGKAFGAVAKPLKGFSEFADLTGFMDPLNGLFAKKGNEYACQDLYKNNKIQLLARITLIAGLILVPVTFFSGTLGLFSLGVLGANIAAFGTMSLINAIKSGLILASTGLTVFDRSRSSSNVEAAQLKKAKLECEMFESLSKANAENVSLKYDFSAKAIKAGVQEEQINDIWKKAIEVSNDVETVAKHKRHVYMEKVHLAEKNRLAKLDDINKIALITIGFVGAFALPVISTLGAISLYQVAAAYIGWQKSDAEVQASKEKVEIKISEKDNKEILSQWKI